MSLAPPSLKERAKLKAENERIKTAERLAKIHRPEVGITALEFPLSVVEAFHSNSFANEEEEEIEIDGITYLMGTLSGRIYETTGDWMRREKSKLVGRTGEGRFKYVKRPTE